MTNEEKNTAPVYFKSLTIQGVNCFKKEQTIDLTNGKGEPAMWTVILGNNNTGKTTVLRCLAKLELRKMAIEAVMAKTNPNKYEEEETIFPLSFKNLNPNPTTIDKLYYNVYANLFAGHSFEYSVGCFLAQNDLSRNLYYLVITSPHPNENNSSLPNSYLDAYGTTRKQGTSRHIEYKLTDRTESLFKENTESIINPEEWFLGTTLDALLGNKKAEKNLERIKKALIDILPDIKNIEIGKEERRVHFITKSGDKVLVNQLGSGYQSLITWVVDFAKRMFDRYPDSENPLAEPAIVLVDEIDLHLHPEWQRKIVSFLREKFPKTQFIVTAHSPLVIQSADEINVVVLQKDDEKDEVTVYQPEITNFQGWTVEEILSDLMKMGDKIYSNEYLKWIKQFDTALDSDNYESAKEAYNHLEKMVHSTATLKMLRMQMSSLMPKSHD